MSIEQAKTISDLSQVIVNSAKVEVDYLRATDSGQSAFIGVTEDAPRGLPPGITTSVVHRIKG